MQRKFLVFFIELTAPNVFKMISVVVVTLVLVTSTMGFPLTTQQHPQSEIGLQKIEKTGVQTSEYHSSTAAGTQAVEPEQYAAQQVEIISSQKNTAVTKVESVPLNAEEPQPLYPQNPVLLPVQPLSVVPFNPTSQVFRPIVVPAEAIADGRVIITPIGSIQERNFHQDVFVTPESQHQGVARPTIYTAVQNQGVEGNQQTYYVQPVEKQTPAEQVIQQTSQENTPGYQEKFIKEQQAVKETAEPVQHQVQPVITNTVEKQAAHKVPAQVESNPQQVYKVQEVPEKQVSHQQTEAYTGVPIVVETAKKQVPSANYETQSVELNQQQEVYNPEQAQVSRYTQNEHVSEQTEPQRQYQQGYSETQQTVEKQAPVEYVPVQTHPVETVQQQPYSVQLEQVENQVPYHQNFENVSEEILKTSEAEPNQQFVNVQSQEVVTYAGEPVHNFGDKLPQQQVQQTLSSVPHNQENPVPVGSTQA